MDVFGRNPSSEQGEYFRNSVWMWHPLWDYCCEVQPSLLEAVPNGHSNDGDGLDEDGALHLATVLTDALESGHTAQWAQEREAWLDAMPDVPCTICDGSGTRHDGAKLNALDIGHALPDDFPCNGCEGKGTRRPFETSYGFSVENVVEFVRFLKACGGFRIC